MCKKYCVLFFIISFLFYSCSERSKVSYEPVFNISQNSLFIIKEDQQYTFGYLTVPEDRAYPDRKTIQLPVYIFKSRNSNPKKDPIIYTVGGPGNSSMSAAQYMQYYQYLDDRDFILFEQRGTQYAIPPLNCPEWDKANHDAHQLRLNDKEADSLLISAVQKCKDRLERSDIDLNMYNTKAIAADIFDLTKALQIEEYNLLSLSYSTKIAQVLMRDYPKGIRSVVMDSPLPLEVNYEEESLTNLVEAMNMMFADCANASICNRTFPDLQDRFYALLEETYKIPLELAVINPNTQKEEIFEVNNTDLISIFSDAYTQDVSNLPLEIHKILNNDWSILKEQLKANFKEPSRGIGKGMRLSVWCSEEYPFSTQAKVDNESEKYSFLQGVSSEVFSTSICQTWQVNKAKVNENQAIKSDIPVLLISGEYDNETPPKWAKLLQNNLTNSFHLTFKAWKHGPTTNWGNPCAMAVANEFFNNPFDEPLLDCYRELNSPIFTIVE